MSMTDHQYICFIPISEKVVSFVNLQKILPGGYHLDVTLVITEFNLYFFVENDSQPLCKEFTFHPYSRLFLIDFIDDLTFRLVFSTNNNNRNRYDGKNIVIYTLFTENSTTVIDTIYKTAKKTLPTQNYMRVNHKINVNKTNTDENYKSYELFLHRYRALLAWKKIYPPQSSLQKLKNYLSTKPTTIDLSIVTEMNADIESYLEATEVNPKMNTIIISGDMKTKFLYDKIKHILFFCPHINKIVIKNEIGQNFIDFLNFLRMHTKIRIFYIEIQNVQITTSFVKTLEEFLHKHDVEITFNQCDFTTISSDFIPIPNMTKLIFESSIMNKITHITTTTNLTELTLKGCSIEISPLLKNLRENFPSIEKVDLSQNLCELDIPENIVLPDKLKELFLSEIRWTSSNFTNMFKSCAYSKSQLSVSFSEAKFKSRRESFHFFYERFKDIDHIENANIVSLQWNQNRIRSIFLKFLMKNNQLKFVSFSGCEVKKHVFVSMKKFVESHRSIETIDLHGSNRSTFESMMPRFLKLLKKSKSVRRIDISKNRLCKKCMKSLAELIATNTRINRIHFDDVQVEDAKSIVDLKRVIQMRKEEIFIEIPETILI